MRLLLHAVAVLVALAGWLPTDAGARHATARAQSVRSAAERSGALGHAPLNERWLEPHPEPSAPPARSEAGHEPAAKSARATRGDQRMRCVRGVCRAWALAAGELPGALLFLRVNGSANAHGARA